MMRWVRRRSLRIVRSLTGWSRWSMLNCRRRRVQDRRRRQLRGKGSDAKSQHERSHTPTMHESRQNTRARVVYLKNSSGTILKISRSRRLSGVRLYFLFFLLLVAVGSQAVAPAMSGATRYGGAWSGIAHRLVRSCQVHERATLGRWRMSVGPPIVPTTVAADPGAHDALTIVSWNTAVGEGDIVQFVRSLPRSDAPLVLLLQEVYRDGPEVPAPTDRGSEVYAATR